MHEPSASLMPIMLPMQLGEERKRIYSVGSQIHLAQGLPMQERAVRHLVTFCQNYKTKRNGSSMSMMGALAAASSIQATVQRIAKWQLIIPGQMQRLMSPLPSKWPWPPSLPTWPHHPTSHWLQHYSPIMRPEMMKLTRMLIIHLLPSPISLPCWMPLGPTSPSSPYPYLRYLT